MNLHKVKIKYDGKIPSVNQLYLVGHGRGGRTWTYQNPDAVKYKDFIKRELDNKKFSEEFEQYKEKDVIIKLDISFILKDNFWRRDVSNLMKATEDAIVNSIGIDDRYNLEITMRKVQNDVEEDLSEYVMVVMSVQDSEEAIYRWSQYGNSNK